MNEKVLYQQKMQAQLDEWLAKIIILKARSKAASADVQLEMNKQIKALENLIEKGKSKLSALAKSSEGAWESLKDGMESAWVTMKSAVNEATLKFKV